ncbi:hypothetical protein NDU88_003978 [Pleurodeles waltl]|uniref:Uncharacterized protein n=1 Tax=Pleurodeles waltl TaxID=8319 RepID=A0AAV7VGX4_PLEWA|nr:hypothetical protein NDU88_003978 [Pleurodeles waltl]
MGKHDSKQPKLNFDHKRSTRQGELEQGPRAAEGGDLAADDHGEDMRTLMLEMRSSLRNIDTKLDNLTSQLDSVKAQVATHETRRQRKQESGTILFTTRAVTTTLSDRFFFRVGITPSGFKIIILPQPTSLLGHGRDVLGIGSSVLYCVPRAVEPASGEPRNGIMLGGDLSNAGSWCRGSVEGGRKLEAVLHVGT